VYPKKTGRASCLIPETIPLDYDFGYLLGAYCAEGCITRTQVSIANNDTAYLEPIRRWCNTHKITTKFYENHDKNQKGWTSSDIRIYSIVLRDLLVSMCGSKSHTKTIDESVMFSNDECRLGFLCAYIGGDGTIYNGRDHVISCKSTSKRLLERIVLMLRTMDIFSYMKKPSRLTKNNRGTNVDNIHQHWTLQVRNVSVTKLATILYPSMKIEHKAERLFDIAHHYTSKTQYRKE
jgi:intein/homing endonuclease